MNPSTSRILPIIVHDLRNGLNAINMSAHMIQCDMPEGDQTLADDVRILQESVVGLAEMLEVLAELASAHDSKTRVEPSSFPAARMIEEVVIEVGRDAASPSPVTTCLDVSEPDEVVLDAMMVRKALTYAIRNALVAAHGSPVELRSREIDGRWVISLRRAGHAAREEFNPTRTEEQLSPDECQMKRLISCHRVRQGADLEIVARLSERLGGTARLRNGDGADSELILDWPTRYLG